MLFSLHTAKSLGKEHQLKSCHSGSRPACQIMSSLLPGQVSLLHVIILVLGLIQQSWYHIRCLGVWKKKRAAFITRRGLGDGWEQDVCCSRVGVFHGALSSFLVLPRMQIALSASVHLAGWFLGWGWRQIWACTHPPTASPSRLSS